MLKKLLKTKTSKSNHPSFMNLEFFAIDSQGFITDNERALEELYGDDEGSRKGSSCLNEMANRIATVFASLPVEICTLLIVDKSVDQIAPIIHEWTYDAMYHDLLNMDRNKYVHEIAGKLNRIIRESV